MAQTVTENQVEATDRWSTPQVVMRSSNLNSEAQSYPNNKSSSPGVEPKADDAENYNREM
jgi:hypothetical protein